MTQTPRPPSTTPAHTAAARGTKIHTWLLSTLNELGLNGLTPPDLSALQTEASFRQFYRVSGATRPLVLMDSPPDKEQNPQFVALARAFAGRGIRVPEILAHDEDNGWLLLSDLGHTHFIDAYRAGHAEHCLSAALATLDTIASVNDPAVPDYTIGRLSDELDIFLDWLVSQACELALPDALFEPARTVLLGNADAQPRVCVHRDFHCKNLILDEDYLRAQAAGQNLEDKTGMGTEDPVGVLDFQDALRGPAGYDLASLLHDCYWKFSDQVIDAAINQAADSMSGLSRRSIDLLAVQRQLKAIGIFARLAIRDDKVTHLVHIKPVLNNLIDLCARYSELTPLGAWLANTLVEPAEHWVAKTTGQHSSTS